MASRGYSVLKKWTAAQTEGFNNQEQKKLGILILIYKYLHTNHFKWVHHHF